MKNMTNNLDLTNPKSIQMAHKMENQNDSKNLSKCF